MNNTEETTRPHEGKKEEAQAQPKEVEGDLEQVHEHLTAEESQDKSSSSAPESNESPKQMPQSSSNPPNELEAVTEEPLVQKKEGPAKELMNVPSVIVEDNKGKGKEKEKDDKGKDNKVKKEKKKKTPEGGTVPSTFFKAMKRNMGMEKEIFQKAMHVHKWSEAVTLNSAAQTLFFFCPLGTTPSDLKGHNIIAACNKRWGITEEDVKLIGTHAKGRSLLLHSPQKVEDIFGRSGITTIRIAIRDELRVVKVSNSASPPSVSMKVWNLPLTVDTDEKFKLFMDPFGEVLDARLTREPYYPDIPQNKGVVEFAFAPMYFTVARRKKKQLSDVDESPLFSFLGDQVCECCECKGHSIPNCELAWKVKEMGFDPTKLKDIHFK